MISNLPGYYIGVIRELLLAAFTADDLPRFCQDRSFLRPIVSRFGPKYNLEEMVAEAIDYCETQHLFEDLLAEVKNANPRQYARFESRLPISPEALAEVPCPYRGLAVFDIQHAADYFGREAMVRKLLEKLKETSLVTVVGPSGCGKSSLVRAGMVPALRQGALPGSESWRVEVFLPGDDPLRALALTLVHILMPDATPVDRLAEARKLADHLCSGELSFADVLAQVKGQHPDLSHLVLVVDQSEETFTQCSDKVLRRIFLETLLDAAETSWVTVVLTLRADFFGRVLEDERLGRRVDAGLVNVLPMSPAERRAAVEQPALRAGRRFEEGLVERILDAVEGSPGDLPLLEFALTELWGQQTASGLLTHDAYEEIGEVRGAIARSADETFVHLRADDQEVARAIFARLVRVARPDEGAEDTRRRIRLDELQPEAQALVKSLADARLLVTSRDPASGAEMVEVAHEALIRSWRALQEWLNRDREFLLWRQRLDTLARIWHESGRGEGALLREALLQEARMRSADRLDELSALEHAYLAESEAAAQRAQAAREAARRRELEQAQKLATEQQARAAAGEKAARDLRRRLAVAVIIGVVAIAAAGAAAWFGVDASKQRDSANVAMATATAAQGQAEIEARNAEEARETAVAERVRAETQATLALSRQLSAQAISFVGQQPDLSMLLSLEALNLMTDSKDRKELLVNLAYSPFLSRFLHGHTALVYVVAYSPDGHTLASGDEDGNVMLWDLSTGRSLHPFLISRRGYVSALAFSPNGQILASGIDTTVTLWDVAKGEALGPPLEALARPVSCLAFSSDGRTLAVGSGRHLWLWNVADGQPPVDPARRFDHSIRAFGPGDRMLALLVGHRVEIADMETGEILPGTLEGHTNEIHGLAFSADGRQLATASYDQSVIVWDVAGRLPASEPDQDGSSADSTTSESQDNALHDLTLLGHSGRVLAVAFDPDGRILASGSTDNTIMLWNVATGERIGQPLHGHNNWVRSLAFSPDGRTLASSDASGTIILWDMGVRRLLEGHTGEVRSVAFSPDGRTLASSSLDKTAILWDAATGEPLGPPLKRQSNWVLGVAFSPDSRTLATFGGDGRVLLWDAETRQQYEPALLGHDSAVIDGAFSPDGWLLATGEWAGTIIIWELPEHLTFDKSLAARPVGHRLVGHAEQVIGLAFSPDSRVLASGSGDGTIILWDVASYQPLGTPLTGHQNWVTSLAFGPDGQTLASSSSDKSIILWDVAGRQPLRPPLTGHVAQVWGVVFDPSSNGQRLISGGGDGTIVQWDVVTGEPEGPPILSSFEMEGGLAVHPDGQTLATGNYSGSTVIVWQLDKTDWPARACRTANRNLTRAEWKAYIGPDVAYRCTCPNLMPGEDADQDACEQSLPDEEQP